jgi:hypothetical protein
MSTDRQRPSLAHLFVHDRTAAVSDLDHQPHDRVAVCVGHAFGRPDRIAFDQGSDDLGAAGERKAVHGV